MSATIPARAMLPAAGLGTRLRPLTDRMPKCMVPVGGRPLMEHTIRWLRRYGVVDIIITLYYLPEVVTEYFGDGSRWGVRITYSRQSEILGTAGGLKHAAWFFDGPFFVWYADNLCTVQVDRLWEFHQARAGAVTIVLHHHHNPTQAGIIGLDERARITRFVEKPRPDEVFSHWANGGIYVLEPQVLDMIPAGQDVDFGRHVFPALLANGLPMYGYRLSDEERFWYIDRPEDLRRTDAEWLGLG